MAKKKLKVEDFEPLVEEQTIEGTAFVGFVAPLEFADLNTIKDKINEIIAFINRG